MIVLWYLNISHILWHSEFSSIKRGLIPFFQSYTVFWGGCLFVSVCVSSIELKLNKNAKLEWFLQCEFVSSCTQWNLQELGHSCGILKDGLCPSHTFLNNKHLWINHYLSNISNEIGSGCSNHPLVLIESISASVFYLNAQYFLNIVLPIHSIV